MPLISEWIRNYHLKVSLLHNESSISWCYSSCSFLALLNVNTYYEDLQLGWKLSWSSSEILIVFIVASSDSIKVSICFSRMIVALCCSSTNSYIIVHIVSILLPFVQNIPVSRFLDSASVLGPHTRNCRWAWLNRFSPPLQADKRRWHREYESHFEKIRLCLVTGGVTSGNRQRFVSNGA